MADSTFATFDSLTSLNFQDYLVGYRGIRETQIKYTDFFNNSISPSLSSQRWDSAYSTTKSNSSNWTNAYTNLINNSAAYLLSGSDVNLGDIPVLSGSWNSTYSTVNSNSASWGISTVITYLSTNNITLSGITVTGNVSADSYSSSIGLNLFSSGSGSFAEGANTRATGSASHAEGESTQAIGPRSHAEGNGSIARGNGGHAEGFTTFAEGRYSHSAGFRTAAQQDYTYVWSDGNLGTRTSTQVISTTRTGQFMVSASGGVFIPGNVGIGTDSRENPLTVNGAISAKSLYVNSIIYPPGNTLVADFSAVGVIHTYSIPSGYAKIRIQCIGGGGGGGSGRKGASGGQRWGGGGGAGGAYSDITYDINTLPSSNLSISVGLSGKGGGAQSVDSTAGANGTDGGNSIVSAGNIVIAAVVGGRRGELGNTTSASGKGGKGTAGGSGGDAGTPTNANDPSNPGRGDIFGSGGGGGGGVITGGNIIGDGGVAYAAGVVGGNFTDVVGGVGSSTGNATAGGDGSVVVFSPNQNAPIWGGSGGSGGGSSSFATANGGNGGNGAYPGAGGGGGGAATNGVGGASGKGGDGANGYVRIIIS
jgi:hypothetical protein